MFGIMAGMNQRDSFVAKLLVYPQLQFIAGRRFPCRGAEADSHGLAFS